MAATGDEVPENSEGVIRYSRRVKPASRTIRQLQKQQSQLSELERIHSIHEECPWLHEQIVQHQATSPGGHDRLSLSCIPPRILLIVNPQPHLNASEWG